MYEIICTQLGWTLDAELRQRLRLANEAEVKRLEAVIEDAKVQHGDVEVGAAVLRKAEYLGFIGDKEAAVKAYGTVPEKALSTGQKADIAMACARLGFVHGDKK